MATAVPASFENVVDASVAALISASMSSKLKFLLSTKSGTVCVSNSTLLGFIVIASSSKVSATVLIIEACLSLKAVLSKFALATAIVADTIELASSSTYFNHSSLDMVFSKFCLVTCMYFFAPAAKAFAVSTGTSFAEDPTWTKTFEFSSNILERVRVAAAISRPDLPDNVGSISVITDSRAALFDLSLTKVLSTKPLLSLILSAPALQALAPRPSIVSKPVFTTKPSKNIARSADSSSSNPVKIF